MMRGVFFAVLTALGVVAGYAIVRPELLAQLNHNPSPQRLSRARNPPPIFQANGTVSKLPPVGSVRVPIIVYHSVRPYFAGQTRKMREFDVAPELFDRQLAYLRDNGYAVISFDALVRYLQDGSSLPKRAVVLNFDDGWKNQYTYALPLLKKYAMTASFFVFTNAIGHPNYLSWDEIREMETAGMTIGGHTRTHPYLFKITEEARLRDEIIGSKKVLEDHLGHPVSLFAFPFGYGNSAALPIIKNAGYTGARLGAYGIDHESVDRYQLKSVQAATDMDTFIKDLGTSLRNTIGANSVLSP